jgi:hypothetical protein
MRVPIENTSSRALHLPYLPRLRIYGCVGIKSGAEDGWQIPVIHRRRAVPVCHDRKLIGTLRRHLLNFLLRAFSVPLAIISQGLVRVRRIYRLHGSVLRVKAMWRA